MEDFELEYPYVSKPHPTILEPTYPSVQATTSTERALVVISESEARTVNVSDLAPPGFAGKSRDPRATQHKPTEEEEQRNSGEEDVHLKAGELRKYHVSLDWEVLS